MITSYHHGMKHEVSVHQFRVRLRTSTVNAMESNARNVARKIKRVVLNQLEAGADRMIVLHDETLYNWATLYGVPKDFIPYSIDCVRELLRGRI